MKTQNSTIYTVAKAAGVSISTVSRSLCRHSLVAVKTQERVRKVAQELGYTPNPYVSTLMSHLRTLKPVPYQAGLALIDTLPSREAWKTFAVQRRFFEGARNRAQMLGYQLERFWAYEDGMSRERLTDMLVSRGIRGVIIPPVRDYSSTGNQLPIDPKQFCCATLGCKIVDPAYHFATNDQYSTGQLAHTRLRECGYKRVGLAIPRYVECIVEQRFSSGFRNALESKEIPSHRNSILRYDKTGGQRQFEAWIHAFKPDAVCTVFPEVRDWLENLGLIAPRDIGIATLDWQEELRGWSGVNQQSERVGASVIDLVVQLLHRNETGEPEYPGGSLVEGTWVDGETTRPRLKSL